MAALSTLLAVPAGAEAESGFLQICKEVAPATISTPFVFDVEGAGLGAAGTGVSVAPGTCSAPLRAGPGNVTILESYSPGLFSVGAAVQPPDRLIAGPRRGMVTVFVPSGDVANRTVVTYRNTLRAFILGVCKIAGEGLPVGGSYQFAIDSPTHPGTLTVTAGPPNDPSCEFVGPIPVNEQPTVQELVPADVHVASITVNPSDAVVGGPDLESGSVTVTGVSPSIIVTFTNAAGSAPECKPGYGYGDQNHCHSGPPGRSR